VKSPKMLDTLGDIKNSIKSLVSGDDHKLKISPNKNMKFPIAIIKSGESPIYFFESNKFGLVSKGGASFYRNGVIYDSEGTKFIVKGIASIRKAPLVLSLKYFQPMAIVDVKYIDEQKLELSQFKQIILDHILLHEKYWIKKDLIESLEAALYNKSSFEEVIRFIK
jgi:hypothetical protein